MRYRIEFQYKGTRYHGWQRQNNAITVQAKLEEVIEKVHKEKIELVGCGRTDSGVHALDYVAHFDSEKSVSDNLVYRLNRTLPPDIAVFKVEKAEDDFHARFHASSRSYIYKLHTKKSSFLNDFSFFYKYDDWLPLDVLNKTAEIIKRTESFESFCKTGTENKHYRCYIKECRWEETSEGYQLYIRSNRFLRGMIRLIVGANLNIARGKLSMKQLEDSINQKQAIPYSWSVPGCGLYLCEILYENQ